MREGELPFGVDNLRFFAAAARTEAAGGAGSYSRGYTSLALARPVGVVGALAPWNFPLIMAIWKIAAPLAAGCTVVLKPAPETPGTAIRLAQLFTEAGAPDGVVNVVTGDAEVGRALVEHPSTAMISLTGSTDAGRQVMAAAAPRVKRLHLELGGKAPLLVFADADLQAAASGAVLAATYNTGQDCTAATRVYVERPCFDEFVTVLAEAIGAVRVGDPHDRRDRHRPADQRRASASASTGSSNAPSGTAHASSAAAAPDGRRRLLSADRRRAPNAGGGDRPVGGVRPGVDGAAVRRRAGGDPARERRRVRPRVIGVDERRRPCAPGRHKSSSSG